MPQWCAIHQQSEENRLNIIKLRRDGGISHLQLNKVIVESEILGKILFKFVTENITKVYCTNSKYFVINIHYIVTFSKIVE